MRTNGSPKNTLGLRLVGEEEKPSASSPFGLLRAGSTTTRRTLAEAQLMASLSYLERRVEILESKYSEVLDTYTSVMTDLVRLGLITSNITTTDETIRPVL